MYSRGSSSGVCCVNARVLNDVYVYSGCIVVAIWLVSLGGVSPFVLVRDSNRTDAMLVGRADG